MAEPESRIAGTMGRVDSETLTIVNDDTVAALRAHLQAFTDYYRRRSD